MPMPEATYFNERFQRFAKMPQRISVDQSTASTEQERQFSTAVLLHVSTATTTHALAIVFSNATMPVPETIKMIRGATRAYPVWVNNASIAVLVTLFLGVTALFFSLQLGALLILVGSVGLTVVGNLAHKHGKDVGEQIGAE